MNEEIQHVTFDFAGERLDAWQAVQRLYLAGFTDAKVLAIGYAVMMGESGRYLKAWHHNVVRNEDGTIKRDADGRFRVKSTDLGFIQKNVVHNPQPSLLDSESPAFVDVLFEEHPELARGDESARIAWVLYLARGWQPWYAYTKGSYKRSLPGGCVAVGQFLGKVLVGSPGIVVRGEV
jgi:DNA-binding transcriptional regulator of glucitol operon